MCQLDPRHGALPPVGDVTRSNIAPLGGSGQPGWITTWCRRMPCAIEREARERGNSRSRLPAIAGAYGGPLHSASRALARLPHRRIWRWPQRLALLWQIYSRCFSLQIHFLQRGHRCGGGRAMSSRMAWRTAGNVGRGGGPLILFFPPCCFKPAILEESVGDHRHERMTVKALPGSALEVIETKFFFQLLVSLLANPSCLDGGR